jgi:hypothetical protein
VTPHRIHHLLSLSSLLFSQLAPITPHVPWMTVDGNHERDWPTSGSVWNGTDSGGECGVALSRRFHMPNPSPYDETWWSINWGPVHFLVFSTEHSFNESSVQYQWIKHDLASVDRGLTPFLIVTGHRSVLFIASQSNTQRRDIHLTMRLLSVVSSFPPCR